MGLPHDGRGAAARVQLRIFPPNGKPTDRILRGQRPLLRYDKVADFAERGNIPGL